MLQGYNLYIRSAFTAQLVDIRHTGGLAAASEMVLERPVARSATCGY
jgi:hypothetical protein